MSRDMHTFERDRNPDKPTRAYNTRATGRGGTPKHFGGGWEGISVAISRTSDEGKSVDDLLLSLRQRLSDIQRISAESPPNAKLKRTWYKGTMGKIRAIRALIDKNPGNPERFAQELAYLEDYFGQLKEERKI